MLGQALLDADVVLTGIAAFDHPGGGSLLGSLKFTVEEEEMLTDLKFLATMSHSVVDGMGDLTFFLDGTDLAELTDGLVRKSFPTVADQADMVNLELTLRIPKGEHQLQIHAKAPAGNLTLEGATWNGYLQARRHSHPATSAANANAKVQGIY